MPYRATAYTEATRADRIAALRAAARELVTDGGFRSATVKSIAARAGVSVGTVYTYFPARGELLADVFRDLAGVELAAVRDAVDRARPPGCAPCQIATLVSTFASRALRGHRLAWALLAEPADPLVEAERLEFRHAYADTLAGIVTDGVGSGQLPHQEPRIVGPGLVGLIGETLIGPLSPSDADEMSSQQLVAQVTDMCLRAVGGERPCRHMR